MKSAASSEKANKGDVDDIFCHLRLVPPPDVSLVTQHGCKIFENTYVWPFKRIFNREVITNPSFISHSLMDEFYNGLV